MPTATNATQKAHIKHAVYDSVFAALMSQPENQLEAYLALHPEARGRVTVDDIKDASIKNVFYNASYNDLSFVAEGRRIVMIEAQSTWSDNIVLRITLYALHVLERFINEHGLDIYRSRALDLPVFEFYVLFTGKGENVPAVMRLSDTVFAGRKSSLEAEATIIHAAGTQNILHQYIGFCEVLREQVSVHGKGQKAVEETLRICREMNYLVPFLTECASEVEATMMTIFSQEYATAMFEKTTREEAFAEGETEGDARRLLSVITNMLKKKFSFDQIADATGFSVPEVKRLAAEHQLA